MILIIKIDLIGLNKIDATVYKCTDNFIGACVPGQDDARCDSLCKQAGDEKGGICKFRQYKQPAPHNFCHCYC
jgi:hypothetical protein